MTSPSILVVGAGWAGLAAAVTLAEHGLPVTVLESAPQAGGRARNIDWQGMEIDNGQHLLLGAYDNLYTLMKKLQIPLQEKFLHQPLSLMMKNASKSTYLIKCKTLPAPFHIITGLLFAKGFSYQEKWQALRFCYYLYRQHFQLSTDISVTTLLQQQHQSPKLIQQLWAPLCLAALSTQPHEASAQVFLRILQQSFQHKSKHSDWVFTKQSLGNVLPQPAITYLQQRNSHVVFNARVRRLLFDQNRILGCEIAQQQYSASHVILACPPSAVTKLIPDHTSFASLQAQLTAFIPEAITTVYLQYAPDVRLPQTMIGLTDSLCQWVFDRSITGQPGLIAGVISSRHALQDLTQAQIATQTANELAYFFPQLTTPLATRVIIEKQGAFRCYPGSDALRPSLTTPISNLWLAGDYTQTGYPACLEGAVKSGVECAEAVIAALQA